MISSSLMNRSFTPMNLSLKSMNRSSTSSIDSSASMQRRTFSMLNRLNDMDEKDLIESMIQQLREMREQVPEYTQLTPRRIQAMIRVAHLNEEFILSGMNAAGGEPRIEQAIQWTYAELLQELGDIK